MWDVTKGGVLGWRQITPLPAPLPQQAFTPTHLSGITTGLCGACVCVGCGVCARVCGLARAQMPAVFVLRKFIIHQIQLDRVKRMTPKGSFLEPARPHPSPPPRPLLPCNHLEPLDVSTPVLLDVLSAAISAISGFLLSVGSSPHRGEASALSPPLPVPSSQHLLRTATRSLQTWELWLGAQHPALHSTPRSGHPLTGGSLPEAEHPGLGLSPLFRSPHPTPAASPTISVLTPGSGSGGFHLLRTPRLPSPALTSSLPPAAEAHLSSGSFHRDV